MLYGTEVADPYLPLPDEVAALFEGDAPSALAVTTVPLDEAINVAVDSDIVLTFNHKIVSESIVVASDAGVIVAGTKSWNAAGTILTFDPTVNLAAATTYLVTIAGVVDIYGRALAPIGYKLHYCLNVRSSIGPSEYGGPTFPKNF
jgi:hypothetical protein